MKYRVTGSTEYYNTAAYAASEYTRIVLGVPGYGNSREAYNRLCVIHRVALLDIDARFQKRIYYNYNPPLLKDDDVVGAIPWEESEDENIYPVIAVKDEKTELPPEYALKGNVPQFISEFINMSRLVSDAVLHLKYRRAVDKIGDYGDTEKAEVVGFLRPVETTENEVSHLLLAEYIFLPPLIRTEYCP